MTRVLRGANDPGDSDLGDSDLGDSDLADAARRYRGCPGLDSPQVQALEAALLPEAGWRLLSTPRAGSSDGTHARLSWLDDGQPVSYTAEVAPGRRVPVPACQAPLSTATKSETEWAVTGVRRVLGPAQPGQQAPARAVMKVTREASTVSARAA